MAKNKNLYVGNFIKIVTYGIVVLAMAILISFVLNISVFAEEFELSNPIITADDSYNSGYKVKYDCIYFGNYPQAEIVASEKDETTVDSTIRNGNDYIVDADLYTALINAKDWDNNGDIVINGKKCRRLKMSDATYVKSDIYTNNYYRWPSVEEYRYFLYQPIKWRVIQKNEDEVKLLADIALDMQCWSVDKNNVGWENSSIRNFANSYDESGNLSEKTYLNKGFLLTAFSQEECNAIEETDINFVDKNKNSVKDKVWLLSSDDLCSETSSIYGFANGDMTDDEARRVKSSTYAKAMGCWSTNDIKFAGNCNWLIRNSSGYSAYIGNSGYADCYEGNDRGFCPSLTLKLPYANVYSYAGAEETKRSNHKCHYVCDVKVIGTCVQKEIKTYLCEICGDTYNEEGTINPTNHTGLIEVKNKLEETDDIPGYSGDICCKGCGKVLIKGNVIPAKKPQLIYKTDEVRKKLSEQKITTNKIKSYSSKKLKKKKIVVKLNAKTTGNGKIIYKVIKYPKHAKKYISVSKKGIVTLKKGAKKGIYKIKVTASKTEEYKSAVKTISIKIK